MVDIIRVFVSWDDGPHATWVDVYNDTGRLVDNDEAATWYIPFMRLQVTFSLFLRILS